MIQIYDKINWSQRVHLVFSWFIVHNIMATDVRPCDKVCLSRHVVFHASSFPSSKLMYDFRVSDLLTSYDQFVMDSTIDNEQPDLDLYLGEKILLRAQNFDILLGWMTNGIEYPILHQIV